MMPAPTTTAKNFLFSYLVSEVRASVQIDSRDKKYIVLSLPAMQIPSEFTWTQAEQHLTIYETYSRNVDDKNAEVFTPIHYSAYFKNSTGIKQYRVHVYCDLSGHLARAPVYQKREQDTWVAMTLSDAQYTSFSDFFISTALRFIQPWLRQTKREIARKRTEIENTCRQLQTDLLSTVNPDETTKPAILKALLSAFDCLIAYTESDRQSVISRKLRAASLYRTLSSAPTPTTQAEEPVSRQETMPLPVFRPTKPVAPSFKATLDEQRARYERSQQNASLAVQCEGVREAELWILGVVVGVITKQTLHCQTDFSRFVSTVEEKGAFLYVQTLLSKKDKNWAVRCQNLALFSEHCTQADYSHLVEQADPQALLHFLKQNQHFLDSAIQMRAGAEAYKDLVQYCIRLATAEPLHPLLYPCMDFLIQEKPECLLVPMDESQTMSFIEWLSVNPAHPLCELALRSKMLARIETFVLLRDNLTRALLDPGIDANKRLSLEARVALYNTTINTFLKCPMLIGMDYADSNMQSIQSVDRRMQWTLAERMQCMANPTYIQLVGRMMQVSLPILEHCSKLNIDIKKLQKTPEMRDWLETSAHNTMVDVTGWSVDQKITYLCQSIERTIPALEQHMSTILNVMPVLGCVMQGPGQDLPELLQFMSKFLHTLQNTSQTLAANQSSSSEDDDDDSDPGSMNRCPMQ